VKIPWKSLHLRSRLADVCSAPSFQRMHTIRTHAEKREMLSRERSARCGRRLGRHVCLLWVGSFVRSRPLHVALLYPCTRRFIFQ